MKQTRYRRRQLRRRKTMRGGSKPTTPTKVPTGTTGTPGTPGTPGFTFNKPHNSTTNVQSSPNKSSPNKSTRSPGSS